MLNVPKMLYLLKILLAKHWRKFGLIGLILAGIITFVVLNKILKKEEQQDNSAAIENLASGEVGQMQDEFGAFDSLIMEDGSIFLVGDNRTAGGQDFRLVKLEANTNLDKNFGRSGIIQTDFGGSGDYATSMVTSGDGKITLAGVTNADDHEDFALARFDKKGNLDSAFGAGGKVNIDFDGGDDRAMAIMALDEGQMIVGGSSANGTTKMDFALLKLKADGTVDTTFGNGGKATLDFGGKDDWILVLGKGGNGEIIAVGNSQTGNIALARFKSDGSLDRDFAKDGKMALGVSGGTRDMAIDSKGRIIVSGGTADGKLVLVRFLANGQLDAGFGNGGIVKSDEGGRAIALIVDENNKIVTAGDGNFQEGNKGDILLIGFLENGNIDSAFGNNGKIIADFDKAGNSVIGMEFEPGGKIKVVATTDKGGFTKHGLVTILDRKKVGEFKFNLEDWKY